MIIAAATVLALGVAALAARRVYLKDMTQAEHAWSRLRAAGGATGAFDPAMVEQLPETARRYFLHAIAPGTPLRTTAELEMEGIFSLGTKDNHRRLKMRARQILSPPKGYVWIPEMGSGLMKITGSDGFLGDLAWVRFWIGSLVPVARSQPGQDLLLSAAGRSVAEAVWVPASLLPANGTAWEEAGPDRARATFAVAGTPISLVLTVDSEGRLREIVMDRWSNANPEKRFRLQPFGGTVEQMATFDGYTIPTHMRAGNHYVTDEYFPFFDVRITRARFL